MENENEEFEENMETNENSEQDENLPRVRVSNYFVSAKYSSTLNENKTMLYSIAKLEQHTKTPDGHLLVTMYPGELIQILGQKNIYRKLKEASEELMGRSMLIEDGEGNFEAFQVVNSAKYEDGVFTVEFNRNIQSHTTLVEKGYSTEELGIVKRFKSNSSLRLYELLRSHIYKSRKSVNNGRVDVAYNLSELRFIIGLADINDPEVKKALRHSDKHNPDWDMLYMKLDKKNRQYEVWSEFQRRILMVAQKEMQESSDIRFEYDKVKHGKAIKEIIFHIYPNEDYVEVVDEIELRKTAPTRGRKRMIVREEHRQYEFPRDISDETRALYDEYVGYNRLKKKNIDAMLLAAGQDCNMVRRAIEAADAKEYMIDDYVAWIIAFIKRGGDDEPIEVMRGSAEYAEQINELLKKANSRESKKRSWERVKERDIFPAFLSDMEKQGVTLDMLDDIFEPFESYKLFLAWKKEKGL